MFKQIAFFKRKEGLTHEEFRDYYENNHVRIRLSQEKPRDLERYVRRYLTPVADPIAGELRISGFDVVTELWFKDKAAWERYRRRSLNPEIRKVAAEDEEKYLDRNNLYFHTVDECDTDMSVYPDTSPDEP